MGGRRPGANDGTVLQKRGGISVAVLVSGPAPGTLLLEDAIVAVARVFTEIGCGVSGLGLVTIECASLARAPWRLTPRLSFSPSQRFVVIAKAWPASAWAAN
jgi:hypothetical protein